MLNRKFLLILLLLSGSLHANWSSSWGSNLGGFLKSETLSAGFSKLKFVLAQNNIVAGATILGLGALYLWQNSSPRLIQSSGLNFAKFDDQEEDEVEKILFNPQGLHSVQNLTTQFELKELESDGFKSILINNRPVITFHDSGLNTRCNLQGDNLVVVIKVGHLKK